MDQSDGGRGDLSAVWHPAEQGIGLLFVESTWSKPSVTVLVRVSNRTGSDTEVA